MVWFALLEHIVHDGKGAVGPRAMMWVLHDNVGHVRGAQFCGDLGRVIDISTQEDQEWGHKHSRQRIRMSNALLPIGVIGIQEGVKELVIGVQYSFIEKSQEKIGAPMVFGWIVDCFDHPILQI